MNNFLDLNFNEICIYCLLVRFSAPFINNLLNEKIIQENLERLSLLKPNYIMKRLCEILFIPINPPNIRKYLFCLFKINYEPMGWI